MSWKRFVRTNISPENEPRKRIRYVFWVHIVRSENVSKDSLENVYEIVLKTFRGLVLETYLICSLKSVKILFWTSGEVHLAFWLSSTVQGVDIIVVSILQNFTLTNPRLQSDSNPQPFSYKATALPTYLRRCSGRKLSRCAPHSTPHSTTLVARALLVICSGNVF